MKPTLQIHREFGVLERSQKPGYLVHGEPLIQYMQLPRHQVQQN